MLLEKKKLFLIFPQIFQSKNQNGVEDIALKLRPTLPKKQLEIPRFSPSAAWRLLSALETPGPTMSTASEEVPVSLGDLILFSSPAIKAAKKKPHET